MRRLEHVYEKRYLAGKFYIAPLLETVLRDCGTSMGMVRLLTVKIYDNFINRPEAYE
jgi:hypothetical protein